MTRHLLAESEEGHDLRNSSKSDTEEVSNKFHVSDNSTEHATPWSCCDQNPATYILEHEILKCGIRKTLSVLNSFCATIDEDNQVLEAGHCLYNLNYVQGLVYSDFPENKSMQSNYLCEGLHRTGTLCGKCQDGYYPLAYSYDMKCVQCPNGKSNWWKFVLAAFLPLTIFYIVILFFKVNVASSSFQGFLFFCQTISLPACIYTCLNYDK